MPNQPSALLKKPWLLSIYPLPVRSHMIRIQITFQQYESSKIANYYKQSMFFVNTVFSFLFKIIQKRKEC